MAEELKVIVFTLAHEEYGIEVDKVRTIERMVSDYPGSQNTEFR